MKHFNIRRIFYLLPIFLFSLEFVACNNQPTDEEIQRYINDTLQASESTRGVNATVADGVVTLTGECEGANCVTDVEQKEKKINGVENVTNNVTVAHKDTDYTLRTQVQSVVSKYEGIQADVANGVIVLRGSINRSQLQPLMTELNALNPAKIDNQLAVN